MKSVKYIFLVLTIAFFGYLIVGQLYLPADQLDLRNVCFDYEGEWFQIAEDGSRTSIEVPCHIDKEIGAIETIIPDDLDPRISSLCLRGQDMQAYMDDELIFEYSTADTRWFGKNSPESYLMIPVTSKDAGKTLRIELISDTGILYPPYVGSELGIWVYILQMYAGELVVAGITLIVGSLTILISKVYGMFNKRNMEITYLGCGVTMAAIWLVVNSVFRQIIFDNVSVANDFPFLVVMLIPFPFLIYMNEVQQNRYQKLYRTVGWSLMVIDITCCVLYILGIRELIDTFIFVALGCFLAIFSVMLTFVLDMIHGKIMEYRYVAFGLLGALISAIIQLVSYFNRTGIFSGAVLAIGLLCLLTGATIHTVCTVFSSEKDKRAAIMANEAKGKFLANMSHEIRTPINAVLGMNEMILRESREASTREYALDIQNAGKSLLSLINDILDISKIDSGKLEIIPVEYDMSSAIHDTMNMISHKAKTKNLEINLVMDENLPSRLRGDDVRIRQILINLLNNAVKYTNEGCVTLSITGDRQGDKIWLHFRVEDTGIGIKEEDLPKLFEEFRRIEENRNRNIEGTGLGISITVQLLKLMGSHLNVTSTYGKGSCFFFDLEQTVVDETPVGNLSERIRNMEREYVYKVAFVAPDVDLLVVDDNAINRKVLRNLLKDTGMRIDEADSGEQSLEKVAHKKYDLIFLDHMMPGMDGIETLHAYKKVEGNLNLETPVVALTANAVTGAKEMYLREGFHGFLTKPIVFEKLEKMIRAFVPEDKIKDGGEVQQQNALHDVFHVSYAGGDESQNEIHRLLEELPEINLEYAYLHSGSPENLYDIMVDFIKMIDSDGDELEKYMTEENLKQYRVKVHAMKASAAMIGAIHLSGMARMLELAAIHERWDTIRSVTPAFLEEWRDYKNKLYPVEAREQAHAENMEIIEFNQDMVIEQLGLLKEAMDELDVDRADGIVEVLKVFDYPEEYKDYMEEIYIAVSNLDAERINVVVEQIRNIGR